ncbi:MAG: hypothetical protein G01um101429_648 [Parcubacteria group bacterium Gr01-1014_29]|nr:MAG: hypothetical protein G01um101429_648 [Parcubacteria group bacterium Gr01-1014_29]
MKEQEKLAMSSIKKVYHTLNFVPNLLLLLNRDFHPVTHYVRVAQLVRAPHS